MEPLFLKPTGSTPTIKLDKTGNIFEFSGNSLPEDVATFYEPVFEWIRNYIADPNPQTNLLFKLTYLNTASSKIIFSLIALFEPMVDKGQNVKVSWCYIDNDEDTLETGKEYDELLNVPFTFTSYESF